MQLSFIQPCSFSGALLLLAVSNLLVWEQVTCLPNYRMPTGSLYQRVVQLSDSTHSLASQVFMDMNFGRTAWTYGLILSPCHTATIPTPENSEEVHQTKSEDLLKVSITILQAWEEPLKHMVAAVAALPHVSDTLLSRTKELEERIQGLLEGLRTIFNRVHPGAVVSDYAFWSEWSDLQSSDESIKNNVLRNLYRCIRRDTHKVDNYLKVLKCRDVHNNNC
ncbi:prolactin-3B1-like [Mastomys coucha]|uniref:prolactin-3B1-like n=1 Tax=Mastomys coucha TaxID=35658 RepID=UPI00126289C1|nr:prolactin-3B1-like [Mastomys coucha]XP_031214652.1 prolactin-3B1-like [Mastomys coucha]XP_031214653.1 prolactin-3B1-like [Mastomys coucha]XP_031214655.1 prolactin-3B1-like [Mastomys coucha]XP_031214656.1 prolactin-3B1-like [Mastomys coucha]